MTRAGRSLSSLQARVAEQSNHVQFGDWVVLESKDGKRVLGHIVPDSTARLGKRKRPIFSILGCRWGDVFVLRDGSKLEPVDDTAYATNAYGDETAMDSGKDNRRLQDTTENQELTHTAIEDMKARGMRGQEMVQTVVQHSVTFENKTPFSQEKYLKRKSTKYDQRFRVMRPTALTVCETYFTKSPEKTLHMRPDSLGLLLGYSGVRAGCKAMVYENCTGLVTAAVAERLGDFGKLFNIFVGTSPPGLEVMKMMNLGEQSLSCVVQTPVEIFSKLDVVEDADSDFIRYFKDESRTERSMEECKFEASERRLLALSQRPKRGDIKCMLREKCDCLVVATRFESIPVLDMLLEHVSPSGTFAVYSMHLQALSELQVALHLSRLTARVELMEANLVNHQILPGRTHPMMSDSACGGYVLWGVRIALAPPL